MNQDHPTNYRYSINAGMANAGEYMRKLKSGRVRADWYDECLRVGIWPSKLPPRPAADATHGEKVRHTLECKERYERWTGWFKPGAREKALAKAKAKSQPKPRRKKSTWPIYAGDEALSERNRKAAQLRKARKAVEAATGQSVKDQIRAERAAVKQAARAAVRAAKQERLKAIMQNLGYN